MSIFYPLSKAFLCLTDIKEKNMNIDNTFVENFLTVLENDDNLARRFSEIIAQHTSISISGDSEYGCCSGDRYYSVSVNLTIGEISIDDYTNFS